MYRAFILFCIACGLCTVISTTLAADENIESNAQSSAPVTTLNSPAANKLKSWYRAGTAAGNIGDVYDNRDRAHSQLHLQRYPQLKVNTNIPMPRSRKILTLARN